MRCLASYQGGGYPQKLKRNLFLCLKSLCTFLYLSISIDRLCFIWPPAITDLSVSLFYNIVVSLGTGILYSHIEGA